MEPSGRKIQNTTQAEEALVPFKKRTFTVVVKDTPKFKSQQGTGIRCTLCGGQTRVTRSMPKPDDGIHGRYRMCDVCKSRMYTEEKIIYRIDKK